LSMTSRKRSLGRHWQVLSSINTWTGPSPELDTPKWQRRPAALRVHVQRFPDSFNLPAEMRVPSAKYLHLKPVSVLPVSSSALIGVHPRTNSFRLPDGTRWASADWPGPSALESPFPQDLGRWPRLGWMRAVGPQNQIAMEALQQETPTIANGRMAH
jgi:hypothetical protein